MPSVPAADHDLEHYGRIARLLNQPRRRALDLLDRFGPLTVEGLLDHWATEHPDDARRRTDVHLRRMVTSALWRLEALGWVVDQDGVSSITPEGTTSLASDTTRRKAGPGA